MASRNPLLHARRRQARLLGGPVDVAIDGSEQCLVARQAIPRGAVVFRERPLACCPDHPPKAGATDAAPGSLRQTREMSPIDPMS